jgi:hypothetical protein
MMLLTANSASLADELAQAGGRDVRRYVNESLARAASERDASGTEALDFVCECGHLSCMEVVSMPLSSFDESSPPGSIVGHDQDAESARTPA